MKKTFRIIFILFILFFLILFIAHTDLMQVWDAIENIGWNFLWLLALTFIAYFVGTIGWYYCLGQQKEKISLSQLFIVRLVGESVSVFNPTSIVGGDYLKTILLKPVGIAEEDALHSVLISRALMIITQIMVFGITVLLLYLSTKDASMLSILEIILVVLTCTFIVLLLFILIALKGRRKWMKLPTRVQRYLSHIKYTCQTNRKNLIRAFFHFSLHWLLGAMEFYFILSFLHLPIRLLESLFMDMGVIFFKSAGVFIPAQLGIEEYGNKVMLALIGITSPNVWLSVSILRRARQLCWIALGGLCYLFLLRKPLPITPAA